MNAYITNMVVDSVAALRQLKCLDLSKNKFHPETLNHLLAKMPSLKKIQTLVLAQSNLTDEVCHSLVMTLTEMPKLQAFNISGNTGLTSTTLVKVLQALKGMSSLMELDLSKLQFGNSEECFKELAGLLLSGKNLRTLNI